MATKRFDDVAEKARALEAQANKLRRPLSSRRAFIPSRTLATARFCFCLSINKEE